MTPNAIAENFNTTRLAVSKYLRILTACDLVNKNNKAERFTTLLK